MRGASGSLPFRMLWNVVTIVAQRAFRRTALRRFASGDISFASGSYIEQAEMAVRSTSMGAALLGSAFIKAMTSAGRARLAAILSEVSLSSATLGKRPNHR